MTICASGLLAKCEGFVWCVFCAKRLFFTSLQCNCNGLVGEHSFFEIWIASHDRKLISVFRDANDAAQLRDFSFCVFFTFICNTSRLQHVHSATFLRGAEKSSGNPREGGHTSRGSEVTWQLQGT